MAPKRWLGASALALRVLNKNNRVLLYLVKVAIVVLQSGESAAPKRVRAELLSVRSYRVRAPNA